MGALLVSEHMGHSMVCPRGNPHEDQASSSSFLDFMDPWSLGKQSGLCSVISEAGDWSDETFGPPGIHSFCVSSVPWTLIEEVQDPAQSKYTALYK